MANGKIKADTLEHSTAGSLDTQYVVNGSLKYWAFINQSTGVIENSLNIASQTDNGTGDTTITFSSAMTDAFHSTNVTSQPVTSTYERAKLFGSNTTTTQRMQNEQTNDGTDRDTTDLDIQGAGRPRMTVTPEFQGTHLFDRLCWAKENLEGHQSDYRVVYEDSVDECAKILVPDPNWMACALQGGILPPVEVYWELAKDEAQPDFKKHTRGYLLHETKPVDAMTEEQAIEYLIMKDCPQSVWKEWDSGNKPKMVICRKEQLPGSREWRNAWKITEELSVTDLAA